VMKACMFVAVRMTAVTLLMTGIAYPIVTTALAQALFPARANGSLVSDGRGGVVGSEWIGQSFSTPGYFWPRPSAAGDKGYDAAASGGSNLGPTSKKLRERMAAEAERLRKENPDAEGAIPADLLTASASGLDPHVSVEAARWQIPRVAQARGIARDRVQSVVESTIEGRDVGVLGEPRVNVLLLNLALDRQFGSAR
jgi:K+-transporting ATPase ATPase C chain